MKENATETVQVLTNDAKDSQEDLILSIAHQEGAATPVAAGTVCRNCGARAERKRNAKGAMVLPKSWMKYKDLWVVIDGKLTNIIEWACGKCKKSCYRVSMLKFPIVHVLSHNQQWEPFDYAVTDAWRKITYLGNEMIKWLWLHDVTPGMYDTNLKPYPVAVNAYKLATSFETGLHTGTLSTFGAHICAKYMANRKNQLLDHKRGISIEYPHPYVIRRAEMEAKMESSTYGKNKKAIEYPVMEIRLAGERFKLRLKSGNRYKHNVDLYKDIVSGDIKLGDALVCGQKCSGMAHRAALASRDKKSRNKMYHRVVLHLAVTREIKPYMPRDSMARFPNVLVVQTGADCLLNFMDKRGDIRRINGDEARKKTHAFLRQLEKLDKDDEAGRWKLERSDDANAKVYVEKHFTDMHRLGEDRKYTRDRGLREGINIRRSDMSEHFKNWQKNYVKARAREVVDRAIRWRVTELHYSDDCRKFFKSFCWFDLKSAIRNACIKAGIKWVCIGKSINKADTDATQAYGTE